MRAWRWRNPGITGGALKELQTGLRQGRWKRAKEVQHWLRQRHEKRLSLDGGVLWLGELGGVLKVPRKTHAQKDADKADEFQRTLCDKLRNLKRGWWKTGAHLGGR